MAAWTYYNLTTQGYRVSAEEARRLRVGLRFPTLLAWADNHGRRGVVA